MTSLRSQRDRGLRWAGWSLGCCLADVTDVTPIWVALDSHFFLMMLRDFSQQQTTLPFFNCQLDIFLPQATNVAQAWMRRIHQEMLLRQWILHVTYRSFQKKNRPTTKVSQRSRDVSCLRRKGMGNVVLVKVSDSGQDANIKCDVAALKLINDVGFFWNYIYK